MRRFSTWCLLWVGLWLAAGALNPPGSAGQPVIGTPKEEFAVPPPEIAPPPPTPPLLPPLPEPPPERQLAGGAQVRVREFRFEGNTVFTAAELAAVVAPWTGRPIASEELQAARDAVTRHYIDHGYVASGASIPDQRVDAGVVVLQIVEGRLTAVAVEGNRRFRPVYFESRLMRGADRPLRVQDLERRLQILQQDPRIRRLSARLEPRERRGEAILRLRVEEVFFVSGGLEWSNDTPASLGEQTGRARLEVSNLLGVGDELAGVMRGSEGLLDPEVHYRIPVTPFDTTLEARFRWSDARIVEEPFDEADFETTALTAGVGILQPVWRSPATAVRVGLLGEWRRSETRVDGEGFGFPGTGADPETGETQISVLRAGAEWLYRTRSRVVVLRQLASVGVPVLDATENPRGTPDSQFASFLTQFRWAERFARFRDAEIVFRTDLQFATDPLVPLEQIAVGGLFSVRGYRENQIVRDQAAIASLELRIPLWRSPERGHQIQLAPFVDVGRGWSSGSRDARPPAQTLIGPGVGLRYRFRHFLLAELYWAASPSKVPEPSETALQDEGVHFRIRTEFP